MAKRSAAFSSNSLLSYLIQKDHLCLMLSEKEKKNRTQEIPVNMQLLLGLAKHSQQISAARVIKGLLISNTLQHLGSYLRY